MKIKELLLQAAKTLSDSQVENASNEARWIFESAFECGKEFAVLYGESEADCIKAERFCEMIKKRADGTPLQYVIGEWDFYGETFKVGEGVLIPRPETEMLVDFALDYLADKKNPVVFDLCAGSGCIGLSVAKNRPDADVFLLEKSEAAFGYLSENKELLGCENARLISGDLFEGFEGCDLPEPDLILSNPPYIESAEIPLLQKEVLREPSMALDGGEDGLRFYREITKYLPLILTPEGVICYEVGIGQAQDVSEILKAAGFSVAVLRDNHGIDRVVLGKKC